MSNFANGFSFSGKKVFLHCIVAIVYELNTWPRNPVNNFSLKSCLFGTIKLVRNTIKSKFTYNG